jgi:hypothetical protein
MAFYQCHEPLIVAAFPGSHGSSEMPCGEGGGKGLLECLKIRTMVGVNGKRAAKFGRKTTEGMEK